MLNGENEKDEEEERESHQSCQLGKQADESRVVLFQHATLQHKTIEGERPYTYDCRKRKKIDFRNER